MGNNYEERVKQRHQANVNNEENNPCFKEYNMSLDCLSINNYDADLCRLQFENYKNCKAFWNTVQRHRRIHGITPLLPPLDERNEIKTRYRETGRL